MSEIFFRPFVGEKYGKADNILGIVCDRELETRQLSFNYDRLSFTE